MAVDRNRERLRQVVQHIKQGDEKSAQTILRDILKETSDDADAWYLNSFVNRDVSWQIKSLERVLLIRPGDEKALARLTKLRLGNPATKPKVVATSSLVQAKLPEAPAQSRSLFPWALGGLAGIIAVALLVSISLLNRSSNVALNNPETLAAAPTASLVIVTRRATYVPDTATPTPTITAIRTSTVTRTPTTTLSPTQTPVPTQTAIPLILPQRSEVGGGTGRILYRYKDYNSVRYQMVDLRDGTLSEVPLPPEFKEVQWVSDGLQLMVNKDYSSNACDGDGTREATPPLQLCLGFMTLDSTSPTMVSGIAIPTMPVLSPNRTQIAFVTQNNTTDWGLWVANVDGTNMRQLPHKEGTIPYDPAWSPDGRFISYGLTTGLAMDEIRIISSDGRGDKVLIAYGRSLSWSPDGTSVVYVGLAGGRNREQIFVASAKGINSRQLTTDLDDPRWPVWSPDGQFIAFVSEDGLYMMKADGSDLKLVTDAAGPEGEISWQPLPPQVAGTPTPTATPTATIPTATPLSAEEVGGGTGRILYSQSENMGMDLTFHLFDLRDGTTTNLSLPDKVQQAQWSPDGQRIMISRDLGYDPCLGESTAGLQSTAAPCVGFVDAENLSLSLMPNLPASSSLALSPDMSLIAYINVDYNNRAQIWVANADGTNPRQVTNLPGSVLQRGLSWTPDGRFITYSRLNEAPTAPVVISIWDDDQIEGPHSEIHLIAPDGTGDRLLIEDGSSAVWSPDGTSIAYTVSERISDSTSYTYIYTADAEGRHIRQITFNEGPVHYDASPAWSPDGQFIVFTRNSQMLYVMWPNGTNAQVVVTGPSLYNVSWQPQPLVVAVATYTPFPTLTPVPTVAVATAVPAHNSTVGGGTGQLLYGTGYTTAFHTIDLNTGTITDLTFPPEVAEAHWMPDGLRYMINQPLKAVICFPQHVLSRMGEPQEPCLGFMDAETLEVRMLPILPFMPQLENLAISPDGNQIAFLGWPTDDSHELQVVRIDGTGLHDVTQNGGGMGDPAWSPDGQFIAYTHQTSSSIEIRRTTVDGSGDMLLVQNAMRPAWSPDGQSLAYMSVSESRSYQLVVANADGTNPRPIATETGTFDVIEWPTWSPDGQLIAFIRGTKLYVVGKDGSNLRMLADSRPEPMHRPSWQPLPSG